MAEGASIVVLSSHMTGDGDRSYPQFVFTASDEPCAQGVSVNRRGPLGHWQLVVQLQRGDAVAGPAWVVGVCLLRS
jgi:hypothetical protein